MGSKLDIDEKQIKRLAVMLGETGLTEIEVEEAGRRIKVSRQAAPQLAGAGVAPAAHLPSFTQVSSAPPAQTAGEGVQVGNPAGTVTSPMVGTIYTAPEPEAKPFVSVGDSVKEGQTLLIIEAMKVMNNLPAPRAGTVKQIMVQDGQPVEYGEALLVIA